MYPSGDLPPLVCSSVACLPTPSLVNFVVRYLPLLPVAVSCGDAAGKRAQHTSRLRAREMKLDWE